MLRRPLKHVKLLPSKDYASLSIAKRTIVKCILNAQKMLGIYAARQISRSLPYSNYIEKLLPKNAITKSTHIKAEKNEIVSNSFLPKLSTANFNTFSNEDLTNHPKRLVFFGPKWYGPRPNFTFNHLISGAESVGYEVIQLDYISALNTLEFSSIEKMLYSSLEESKPNYILFSSSDEYVINQFREFNPTLIENLREAGFQFKLINVCGDLWRAEDFRSIEEWGNACDLFLHIDNQSIVKYSSKIREKALFYPYIGLSVASEGEKINSNSLFYSGQVRDSDRRIMLTNILKNKHQYPSLDLNFKVHYKWSSRDALSEAEYQKTLAESKFCLSFAQKGKDHFLIPWRSLEAISMGCVLLHQEGEYSKPLNELFLANEHYLAFETENDLMALLRDISQDTNAYDDIGKNARAYLQKNYSTANLWGSISRLLS